MRTFICIDFPLEIEKEIERIQKIILKKKFTGKITESDNLHLTLKFLGEISQEKLEEVKIELGKVQFEELNLALGQVGAFAHNNMPRIVWIKILGAYKLQSQIDNALIDMFPKEARFMSHVTLARVKYVKDKKDFIDYVNQIKPMKLKFKIPGFKLKESKLNPSGPEYITLEEYFADNHLK